MLFPVTGVVAAVWCLLSVLLVADLPPWEKWRVPPGARPLLTAVALLLAPALLPLLLVAVWATRLADWLGERKRRRELVRLDELTLENSRGAIDPDKLNGGEGKDALLTVKRLILKAVESAAADMFIDPDDKGGGAVRIRAGGVLRVLEKLDAAALRDVIGAVKAIARMDPAEHRMPQDGTFSARLGGARLTFRAASVGVYAGEKLSLRILSEPGAPRRLREFGLGADDLKLLTDAAHLPSGLILISGPAGSGRTSVLYAMLREIDFALKNAISIEDSVADRIPEVSQIEANLKAGASFASLLRGSLRQNPDVLALDEVRDRETAEAAVEAARTGHLVFAVVRSGDNRETVDRLGNIGVSAATLAETLKLAVVARLVRTLCPHCRRQVELPGEYREYFAAAGLPTDRVFQATGCPGCDGSGYAGKRAVFDILAVDAELREQLAAAAADPAALESLLAERTGRDMLAFKAFQLAAQGETDLAEVNRAVYDLE